MIPFVLIISLSAAVAAFALQSTTADMSQSTVQQEVSDTSTVVRQSIPQFQAGYQVLTEKAGGFAPAVLSQPDGGFRQHFGPLLRLLPATPKQMAWRYGLHPEDGSAWAGMNYVCLSGPAAVPGNTLLGLRDALNMAHPGRTFLSDGCAMPGPAANPNQPTALTLYLVYTPPADTSAPATDGSATEGGGSFPPSAEQPLPPANPGNAQGNGAGNGQGNGQGTGQGNGQSNGKGPDGAGAPGLSPWDDSGCKGKSPRCR